MEDFKQTFSDFHRDLKQILFDSCQVIMQDIRDIVENINSKMCHLAGDVVEEIEEPDNDRNVSTDSEIEASVEMPDDNQIVELKKLKGQTELQTISEIVFLMECYGKEGVVIYGRISAEKSESLRGAVGRSDF